MIGAMVRSILRFGAPELQRPASAVPVLGSQTQQLIDDMVETMYAAPGIGLAETRCPRPRGRSGCVTTPTTRWREASSAASVGTAKSGVPKNAMRSGACVTIGRGARAAARGAR